MTVSVKFDGDLSADIRRLIASHDTSVMTALEDIGQRGVETARGLAPVGSGHFRDTIEFEVTDDGVNVGSSSRIAHIIESGRSPGAMPPPAVIAEQYGLTPSEGFLVARAIGKRGTPASRVFDVTRKDMRADVDRIARDLSERLAHIKD